MNEKKISCFPHPPISYHFHNKQRLDDHHLPYIFIRIDPVIQQVSSPFHSTQRSHVFILLFLFIWDVLFWLLTPFGWFCSIIFRTRSSFNLETKWNEKRWNHTRIIIRFRGYKIVIRTQSLLQFGGDLCLYIRKNGRRVKLFGRGNWYDKMGMRDGTTTGRWKLAI